MLDRLIGRLVGLLVGLIVVTCFTFGWNSFAKRDREGTIRHTQIFKQNVQDFWVEMQKSQPLNAEPTKAGDLTDLVLSLKKAQKDHDAASVLATQNPGLLTVNDVMLIPADYKNTPLGIRRYVFEGNGESQEPRKMEWYFREDRTAIAKSGIDALLKEGRFVAYPILSPLIVPSLPFLVLLWLTIGLGICLVTEIYEDKRDVDSVLAKPTVLASLFVFNFPYGLYRASKMLGEIRKRPKNAHAKEMRKTNKLLRKLETLEQTEAVQGRVEKLQETLAWMKDHPNSTTAEVARQRQRLERETAADKELDRLIPQIDDIVTIPLEEEARAKEHNIQM